MARNDPHFVLAARQVDRDEGGSARKHNRKLALAIATAAIAVAGGTPVYAQDKYSLKSPSGIAFSDFRGYEVWSVVSSARTDEVLKVIVANPTAEGFLAERAGFEPAGGV